MLQMVVLFFFFQAEDGIRDKLVTGVQTCALPISREQVSEQRGADWMRPLPRPRAHVGAGPVPTVGLAGAGPMEEGAREEGGAHIVVTGGRGPGAEPAGGVGRGGRPARGAGGAGPRPAPR